MTGDARYQMLWDCPGCETAGLLALDHKFCPACGTPQDPKLRYFPSDDQKVLVEDHPYHGADKVCGACDAPNAGNAGFCTACGSPLDDAKAAARRADRVVGDGAVDAGDSAAAARAEAKASRQAEEERRTQEAAGKPAEPPKKARGFFGSMLGIGCVALITVIPLGCIGFFLLSWLLQTQDTLTVSGHAWDRRIDVEVLGPVNKSAWQDQVPAGASGVSCRPEKKSTRKVPDGEDCHTRKKDLGDGTFSEVRECQTRYRNEDVMGEKCSYTVIEWSKGRSEQAAGNDLSPRWPTVTLSGGEEREGTRHQTYTVQLTDSKGASHRCELSEAAWSSYAQGAKVQATFGGLTGLIDCGSLTRAP